MLVCHAWSSSAPIPPACHRARGRQGQALRVAAKSAAILDRHSTRWRSRTAVGTEEWLRRGQTKEWVRKQVSCQDFVITIRDGRHQFSWQKKQEQSRISPSDTVAVLKISPAKRGFNCGHIDEPRERVSRSPHLWHYRQVEQVLISCDASCTQSASHSAGEP